MRTISYHSSGAVIYWDFYQEGELRLNTWKFAKAMGEITGYEEMCIRDSLEDVYTDFLNIGKIFRVEDKAEALVNEMKSNIEETAKKVEDKEKVSVFVCDASSNEESCMTVGGGLPQELLEKAGGENVVTDVEANWKRGYSWEKIIAADPEWIVIDYYASADEADAVLNLLKSDPQLNQMQAVLKDQIVLVGLTDISCSCLLYTSRCV